MAPSTSRKHRQSNVVIEEENIQRVRRIEEEESEDTFVHHGPRANNWGPRPPKGPRYQNNFKPRPQPTISSFDESKRRIRAKSEAPDSVQWSTHAETVSAQPGSFSRVYAGAQHSGSVGASSNQRPQIRSNITLAHNHGPSQVSQSISVAVHTPNTFPRSNPTFSGMSDEMLDTYAEIEELEALRCQVEEYEHKDRQMEYRIEHSLRKRPRDSGADTLWKANKKSRKTYQVKLAELFDSFSSENKSKSMIEMNIKRKLVLLDEQMERHRLAMSRELLLE